MVNDPEFLQSVLEGLPGVDPSSEAIFYKKNFILYLLKTEFLFIFRKRKGLCEMANDPEFLLSVLEDLQDVDLSIETIFC